MLLRTKKNMRFTSTAIFCSLALAASTIFATPAGERGCAPEDAPAFKRTAFCLQALQSSYGMIALATTEAAPHHDEWLDAAKWYTYTIQLVKDTALVEIQSDNSPARRAYYTEKINIVKYHLRNSLDLVKAGTPSWTWFKQTPVFKSEVFTELMPEIRKYFEEKDKYKLRRLMEIFSFKKEDGNIDQVDADSRRKALALSYTLQSSAEELNKALEDLVDNDLC